MSFAGGMLLGSKLDVLQQTNLGSKSAGKLKLNKLLDFIDKEYVDEVNTDSIVALTVSNFRKSRSTFYLYSKRTIGGCK